MNEAMITCNFFSELRLLQNIIECSDYNIKNKHVTFPNQTKIKSVFVMQVLGQIKE